MEDPRLNLPPPVPSSSIYLLNTMTCLHDCSGGLGWGKELARWDAHQLFGRYGLTCRVIHITVILIAYTHVHVTSCNCVTWTSCDRDYHKIRLIETLRTTMKVFKEPIITIVMTLIFILQSLFLSFDTFRNHPWRTNSLACSHSSRCKFNVILRS